MVQHLSPLLSRARILATGKLVWTDGHARHKHQSPDETIRQLDRALTDALALE